MERGKADADTAALARESAGAARGSAPRGGNREALSAVAASAGGPARSSGEALATAVPYREGHRARGDLRVRACRRVSEGQLAAMLAGPVHDAGLARRRRQLHHPVAAQPPEQFHGQARKHVGEPGARDRRRGKRLQRGDRRVRAGGPPAGRGAGGWHGPRRRPRGGRAGRWARCAVQPGPAHRGLRRPAGPVRARDGMRGPDAGDRQSPPWGARLAGAPDAGRARRAPGVRRGGPVPDRDVDGRRAGARAGLLPRLRRARHRRRGAGRHRRAG
jgi:hypothetical protein